MGQAEEKNNHSDDEIFDDYGSLIFSPILPPVAKHFCFARHNTFSSPATAQ